MADSEKAGIPAELVRNGLRPDVARMLRDAYNSVRMARRMLDAACDQVGDASANLGAVELADVRVELDRMHDDMTAMDPALRKCVSRLEYLSSLEVKR